MRCCACLCALVLLASPSGALALQPAPPAGRLEVVTGTAFVVRGGATVAAAAGAEVFESDVLRTGPDGRLSLMLINTADARNRRVEVTVR